MHQKWPSIWQSLRPDKVLAISSDDADRFGRLLQLARADVDTDHPGRVPVHQARLDNADDLHGAVFGQALDPAAHGARRAGPLPRAQR